MRDMPWWLGTDGTERCPHCDGIYHWEIEIRCAECDGPLCGACAVFEREAAAVRCPGCEAAVVEPE